MIDLSYSVGLTAAEDGRVRTVAWGGPAFRAGMRPGVRIVAVGGQSFSRAGLTAAVRNAAKVAPVLTVEQDGGQSDRTIAYRGTLRYPRLERLSDRPDTLAALIAPR